MRLLVVLALIGVACALPPRKDRIVGGSPVPIEKYPFMVSMQITWIEGFYAHVCGGTLITSFTVVSAAHCYYWVPFEIQWRARIGAHNNTFGGSFHRISRINPHPDYTHVLWLSDIATIRLASPVTLSNRVRPARIAGPNYPLTDHMRLYIAGWGGTYSGDERGSDVLLDTYVHVINHELCTQRYYNLKVQSNGTFLAEVTPGMLCTGILDVGGQDACQGDSGGPVIHGGDILVGVTSWGYGCAHPYYPGVNARVPSYTQWIVDNAV